MKFLNEQKILKIIRYVPSIFLLCVSLLIFVFLYIENLKNFNQQKASIEENYTIKNKEIIRQKIEDILNRLEVVQKETEKELKRSLQNEMNKAYSIVNSIYERNKDKDPKLVKKLIKDSLRDYRFNNNRGYFFIHDKTAFANTMHPIMPNLEGKNSYNVKDAKGVYIIRKMHEVLKQKDEAFLSWYWYKPNDNKNQYKKIGILKNFEPYNWFIATGEYVKDFEKELKAKILEELASTNKNNSTYTFILDKDGVALLHPIKSYVNKDLTKDKGQSYIETLLEVSNYGGFVNYIQDKKPDTLQKASKTTYVKKFEKWDWVIGTGFYQKDIQELIKQRERELKKNLYSHMKNTILVTLILTFILLIVSLYTEKAIQKRFDKYKEEIQKNLDEKIKQQNIMAQQAKMAAMGDMIGNIAHQWRQPLSSITSSSSSILLQNDLGILKTEDLVEGLKSINQKVIYLSDTIDDFRNFFSGEKSLVTFNIEDAINDALFIINAKLTNKDIHIIKSIENIRLYTLKNELLQVLINIFNNAQDVLEKCERKEKFIFIKAYKKKKKLIIEIKDTGGGVQEKIINKIFEPYFTTKHQSQGTGIGLYMSKQIIEKHINGSLQVTNEKFKYKNTSYKGACFKITIKI